MNRLIDYAFSFVGTPYKWGGNNPIEGLDCSGFVCELMRSAGVIGKEDHSAQGLFDILEKRRSIGLFGEPGAIVFYGKSVLQITHVGFCIDRFRSLESGGGGSATRTEEDAAKGLGAFVRLRLIHHRPDVVAIIKPDYSKIGLI